MLPKVPYARTARQSHSRVSFAYKYPKEDAAPEREQREQTPSHVIPLVRDRRCDEDGRSRIQDLQSPAWDMLGDIKYVK